MNQRLIAQSGTFVIPGILADSVETILATYGNPQDVFAKFILKTATLRDRAMLELYTMNVTYYSLFPASTALLDPWGMNRIQLGVQSEDFGSQSRVVTT